MSNCVNLQNAECDFNVKKYIGDMFVEMEDAPEAVGARLKAVREILKMTKRDFAGRAGISEQVYGAAENGSRDLSLPAAKQLRRTYSLPLEFLYFGKMEDLPARLSNALMSKS